MEADTAVRYLRRRRLIIKVRLIFDPRRGHCRRFSLSGYLLSRHVRPEGLHPVARRGEPDARSVPPEGWSPRKLLDPPPSLRPTIGMPGDRGGIRQPSCWLLIKAITVPNMPIPGSTGTDDANTGTKTCRYRRRGSASHKCRAALKVWRVLISDYRRPADTFGTAFHAAISI